MGGTHSQHQGNANTDWGPADATEAKELCWVPGQMQLYPKPLWLLPPLEHWSCYSFFLLALQTTSSHSSPDASVCQSVENAGLLCALVISLQQSVGISYLQVENSDVHEAKKS